MPGARLAREGRSLEEAPCWRLWRVLWRAAVGLAIAAATGELICRQIYFGPKVFDPELGLVFAPAATVVTRIEGAAESHWSEHGVRRSSKAGPSVERPILVIGDSFTEALQVGDDSVYTAQLEQQLSDVGMERPILNVAESGNSLADYVANAAFFRKTFHPAWTVVQIGELDCGKEAWDATGAAFTRDVAGGAVGIRKAVPLDPEERGWLRRFVHQARNRSALFAYSLKRSLDFANAWRADPPMFNASRAVPRDRAQPPDNYPLELELQMLVEAYAGRLTILYTTPFYAPPRAAVPSQTDARVEAFARSNRISFVKLGDMYRRLATENIAASGFANTSPFKGHWNESGHKEVARLLAAELGRIASTNGIF